MKLVVGGEPKEEGGQNWWYEKLMLNLPKASLLWAEK